MTYDTVIIGKGPAGISAAVYLARAGLSVLVIGKDAGALEKAERIENYYGFPQAVSGVELARRGIDQALRFGVAIVEEEAVQLAMEDCFAVATVSGTAFQGRSILLATGKQRTTLKVPGFEDFRGKGISFCATCDGFFYRGKKVALVGSGDYAASELAELLHFTKDITVFTNGAASVSEGFPPGVTIVTDKIAAFEGNAFENPLVPEKVGRIVTMDASQSRTVHSVDGIFVAIGTAGAADFAAKMGVEVNGTDIAVDRACMTAIPGIFAAGDCTGGFLQVAKAVSEGAIASKGIIAFLKA